METALQTIQLHHQHQATVFLEPLIGTGQQRSIDTGQYFLMAFFKDMTHAHPLIQESIYQMFRHAAM